MLDLAHPRTPAIFDAARQLDLIMDDLKRMTIADRTGRLFLLEMLRPSFAALRWLMAERFEGSPAIAASLAELEAQAEALAALGLREARRWSADPPDICPACAEGLTIVPLSRARPRRPPTDRYCARCLGGSRTALDRVASLEDGFGTMAI